MDVGDIAHLHKWLRTISNAHLQRNPGRDANVFRTRFASDTLRLFRLMDRAREPEERFREFLPLSCTIERLKEAFAKMLIVWTRMDASQKKHGHARETSNVLCSHLVRVTLVPIRSAIRSGVFHCIPPEKGLFTVETVYAVMKNLARTLPDRWSFGGETDLLMETKCTNGRQQRDSTPPITEQEVQQLLDFCQQEVEGPWICALLVLLVTATPRLNELRTIRLHQAYDLSRGVVQQRMELIQKGNRPRFVFVRPMLQAALEALIATHLTPLTQKPTCLMFIDPTGVGRPTKTSFGSAWRICVTALACPGPLGCTPSAALLSTMASGGAQASPRWRLPLGTTAP